jgi:hypothetical protein
VSFETATVDAESFQSFLTFAVDPPTGVVEQPLVLSMAVTDEGWRVTNNGLAAAS